MIPATTRAAAILRVYASTGQVAITALEALEIADALQPHTRQPLTQKQYDILGYIRTHIEVQGYAPSFEEIAAYFEFRSLATVAEHLGNLERKGWITRAYNEARAITLVEAPANA